MLITKPVFLHKNYYCPTTTFLRFSNIVSREDNNSSVVISNYTQPEMLPSLIREYSKKNLKREIIIDCSAELINTDTIDILVELAERYKITLYFNDCRDHNDLEKLKKSKISTVQKFFFVEYFYYYIPNWRNSETLELDCESPSFLLLTGKPKFERAVFLYKLFKKNLQSYGKISYFGIKNSNEFVANSSFQLDPKEHSFYSKFYHKVKEFNSSFADDLTVDVDEFDHSISHTRRFNADFYSAVDFVVIFETDLYTNTFFPTEKPMKAIMLNKKFIYLGVKGSLAHLKKLMLELHGRDISDLTDWIDTKYDGIEDLEEKLDCVIELMDTYIKTFKQNKLI